MFVVCSGCGGSNGEDARFCSACGRALVPLLVREERKVVTVLFADLVGFTSRAEILDPEDVRELLSPYYARLRSELERYGGTVEKFIGDAVMALFGAPVSHEDDPERAVRAALEIRDWIVAEGELQVRIAVNTGEALISVGARTAEGEGMAAGDVVNATARLQAAAPVNGVLVGESTYRATAQTIIYDEVDPVVAKGKKEPLPVWRALEPRSALGVDSGRRLDRALVGRGHETEVLLEAFRRSRRERSPQLVTLVGVPGIGKSRLVRELYERVGADPELIFWRQGRCLPYGDAVSFWAIVEIVREHAGILETDRGDVAGDKLDIAVRAVAPSDADWLLSQLRPLIGLPSDSDRGEQDETFAAWRRFFEALADERPLVLVFEDLHWADDALLDFVNGLVERARGVAMLVLCTARPELLARRTGWGGGKANASSLTLSPLSDDDTSRLVGSLLHEAPLPAELARSLLSRAEGNPLFAEEYVRMLQDRGLLRSVGGAWELDRSELPLPETVQGIIAARLDALGEGEKSMVQDAAVVGKAFWIGALCTIGGRDRRSVEETVHSLERREIVRRERRTTVGDDTEYAFLHTLVRDVAYAQIPRAARARKHLLAAAWIESLIPDPSEGHSELLAHHYLAALRLRPDVVNDLELAARARTLLQEEGNRAWSIGAYSAAVSYYGSALELWSQDRPATLLLRHGQALFTTEAVGGRERLLEARDALLAEGRAGEAAEAELMIAESAFDAGEGAGAIEHLRRAVELVEDATDDTSKAFVLGWGAWRLRSAAIDRERVLLLAREGVRVARLVDSAELQSLALNGLGVALAGTGAFDQSFACFEEALALARNRSPFQTIRSVGNFASVVQEYGDIRRARGLHEEGHVLAVEYGVGFATRWLQAELVIDDWHAGEWERARTGLDIYLEQAERTPYFMDGPVAGVSALLRLAEGDLEGAHRRADWSLRRARESVEHQILCPALSVAARVSLESERPTDAAILVEELVAILRAGADVSPHEWFLQLAVVLVGLGRPDEVTGLVRDLEYQTRWVRAGAMMASGNAAEAADELVAIGSLPYEAWARLQSGDPNQIEQARSFYRKAGATRYATLADTKLAEIGAS